MKQQRHEGWTLNPEQDTRSEVGPVQARADDEALTHLVEICSLLRRVPGKRLSAYAVPQQARPHRRDHRPRNSHCSCLKGKVWCERSATPCDDVVKALTHVWSSRGDSEELSPLPSL